MPEILASCAPRLFPITNAVNTEDDRVLFRYLRTCSLEFETLTFCMEALINCGVFLDFLGSVGASSISAPLAPPENHTNNIMFRRNRTRSMSCELIHLEQLEAIVEFRQELAEKKRRAKSRRSATPKAMRTLGIDPNDISKEKAFRMLGIPHEQERRRSTGLLQRFRRN